MKSKAKLLQHIAALEEHECKTLLDFLNKPEQVKKMVEAYSREQTEMPSDVEIRKAIVYGYNLTANASLAQIDVIHHNIEIFIEDYLKQSISKESDEKCKKCNSTSPLKDGLCYGCKCLEGESDEKESDGHKYCIDTQQPD